MVSPGGSVLHDIPSLLCIPPASMLFLMDAKSGVLTGNETQQKNHLLCRKTLMPHTCSQLLGSGYWLPNYRLYFTDFSFQMWF
jgi:hypothetical protein